MLNSVHTSILHDTHKKNVMKRSEEKWLWALERRKTATSLWILRKTCNPLNLLMARWTAVECIWQPIKWLLFKKKLRLSRSLAQLLAFFSSSITVPFSCLSFAFLFLFISLKVTHILSDATSKLRRKRMCIDCDYHRILIKHVTRNLSHYNQLWYAWSRLPIFFSSLFFQYLLLTFTITQLSRRPCATIIYDCTVVVAISSMRFFFLPSASFSLLHK